jgi:methionyl-tRNA formyltransferase
VFGYGEVGIRCLATLLAHGIRVPLVVTHRDDPSETRWFGSLAQFAEEQDIAVVRVEDSGEEHLFDVVAKTHPDFIFSFFYRRMLSSAVLALPRFGAMNMHGSLLPKYRGRAPVNWAIVNGEIETGATLHYMTSQPDAGDIVAQRAVPIHPDDTALDVFRKVCVAAELILDESLPAIVDGVVPATPQVLSAGSYFGARKPDDGTIRWEQSARQVHNLVRAVAPPFPAARTLIEGKSVRIFRTVCAPGVVGGYDGPVLFSRPEGRCYAQCGDGSVLRILGIEIEGRVVEMRSLAEQLEDHPLRLPIVRAP